MKLRFNSLFHLVVVGVALIPGVFGVQSASGGTPGKPAPHSQSYRDANILMLRFQNALAAEKWTDALALCSDRLRAKAAEWSNPAEFFRQTMPVEDVLAQDFGCWNCGEKAYGLVINLTAPAETPVIQWYWAIVATNGSWVVDYPPVKLDEYVAKKKSWLKQRDDELARVREELDSQIQNLKVRLTATSERFVIGQPMSFKIELVNSGKKTVEYQNCGIRYHPLKVCDKQKEPLVPYDKPSQIFVNTQKIAPDSSVVLAEGIDLTEWYSFTKPGKYSVQFDGSTLEIGKQMPVALSGPGLFDENQSFWWPHDFVSSMTKLPSNVVEIEIIGGKTK